MKTAKALIAGVVAFCSTMAPLQSSTKLGLITNIAISLGAGIAGWNAVYWTPNAKENTSLLDGTPRQ